MCVNLSVSEYLRICFSAGIKDLKRIRKARSDEELVAYLLDLATATDLSDSPRYGKRCTTVYI